MSHVHHEVKEVSPHLKFPSLDNLYKEISQVLPFFDLGNPIVLLLTLFLSKKAMDAFNTASSRVTESLWFSQKKDDEINKNLQLLRETIGCDRVILGLIVNGETAIGQQYHLRKLVITHESCGANTLSAIKGKEARFSLVVLTKEGALYTPDKDWVMATIEQEDLDKSCRRYLDSIDCHTIFTIKMVVTGGGKNVDLGYISFQWAAKPNISFLERESLDWLLEQKLGKDMTFYQNKIITTVLANSDRRKLFTQIGNLLTWKK